MAKKVLRVAELENGVIAVYRGEVVPCFDLCNPIAHPVFDNLPYNTCTSASDLAYEIALHAFLGYEVVYDIEI